MIFKLGVAAALLELPDARMTAVTSEIRLPYDCIACCWSHLTMWVGAMWTPRRSGANYRGRIQLDFSGAYGRLGPHAYWTAHGRASSSGRDARTMPEQCRARGGDKDWAKPDLEECARRPTPPCPIMDVAPKCAPPPVPPWPWRSEALPPPCSDKAAPLKCALPQAPPWPRSKIFRAPHASTAPVPPTGAVARTEGRTAGDGCGQRCRGSGGASLRDGDD
jgi:hypothetical protein